MFNNKKKQSKDTLEGYLDAEMVRSAQKLSDMDPSDPEYKQTVDNVKKMHDVKDNSKTVDINTVLTILGSVGSVAMIIGFEKLGGGIFTSKAASFILKPRV